MDYKKARYLPLPFRYTKFLAYHSTLCK